MIKRDTGPRIWEGDDKVNLESELKHRESDKFKNYVRSTAFSISLSQNQIEALFALAEDGDEQKRIKNSHFVSGINGIIRRGLAEHHEYPDRGPGKKMPYYTGFVSGEAPAYTVTEAGFKMYELLKLAGFQ